MEFILTITYTLLFVWFIQTNHFFKIEGLNKAILPSLFILKIIAGLSVWAIYTFYYRYRPTADIFKYFDASKVLFESLFQNSSHFWQMLTGIGGNQTELYPYYDRMNFWLSGTESSIYNDNHLIIRINTILRFLSRGYYHVHTVFFCFFSTLGLTALFKVLHPLLPKQKYSLLFILFGLPSLLFWGSGVLKESIIIGAIGLLIYACSQKLSLKHLTLAMGSLSLIIVMKFHIFVSLIPSIFFMLLIRCTNASKPFLKYTFILLCLLALSLNINTFTSLSSPFEILTKKHNDFQDLANGNLLDATYTKVPKAGSAITIPVLKPNIFSLIKNSPQGFINTLLRPFPNDVNSFTTLMALLENILIISLIIKCIWYIKPLKTIAWKYVIACLSFVVIQFVIIGETTPIIGAIVRYKVVSLPFLLIAFLFLTEMPDFKPSKKLIAGGKS